MKLVEGASRCWRWFSVQFYVVIGALPIVWVGIPPDVREMLPEEARPWVFTVLAVAGLIGRLIDQKDKA
ncbi:hypothetical protein [Hoeflea sp.]|uniref:DUF7940 domain-containing protein n=1 Tax=Hoeflea sp. TaxID=1940281 RepID=UPI001994F63E|nr:hypothetical protein [Hoeflea sp.]MBC7286130.1 hypothetical protein [Hoeflea sp.]